MILAELHIHNLRNLLSTRLQLNPKFNLIQGNNGCGKTTLLEAVYILGTGHSFRSRDISSLIHHGESSLTVFARSPEKNSISVQKALTKPTRVKLNGVNCTSSSQLAYALPLQVFYQDIFQIIDTGPSIRRRLLDWSLFHVKQDYLLWLNQYKRLLKQRNALLKQKTASQKDFIIWDKQLSLLAEQIHQQRALFFAQWQEQFSLVLCHLSDLRCRMTYYKGWDRKETGMDLQSVLEQNFKGDRQRLYTQFGAHQAEIIIEANEQMARQVLSRGQQKIILFALKLSQAALIGKPCLYLFDDFSAELDQHHQGFILDYLSSLDTQIIMTSIEPLPLDQIRADCSLFQIKEGKIKEKSVSRET